jgi:hypothetical protein
VAVAVGDGSTAVAMAAEVHGSIADRRLHRTHLPGAGNHADLAWVCGSRPARRAAGRAAGSLWMILEEDPAVVIDDGADSRPPDFVQKHLESLIGEGIECTTCLWQQPCGGYFKRPERAYSCAGVKQLFARIQAAADEITRELARAESNSLLQCVCRQRAFGYVSWHDLDRRFPATAPLNYEHSRLSAISDPPQASFFASSNQDGEQAFVVVVMPYAF